MKFKNRASLGALGISLNLVLLKLLKRTDTIQTTLNKEDC